MTEEIHTVITQMSWVGRKALVGLHDGTRGTIHGPVALGLRHRGLITRDGDVTPLGCTVANELRGQAR